MKVYLDHSVKYYNHCTSYPKFLPNKEFVHISVDLIPHHLKYFP